MLHKDFKTYSPVSVYLERKIKGKSYSFWADILESREWNEWNTEERRALIEAIVHTFQIEGWKLISNSVIF